LGINKASYILGNCAFLRIAKERNQLMKKVKEKTLAKEKK